MTCNQCVNIDGCKQNPAMVHTMWMIDFWENAEQRCGKFEKAIRSERCVCCGAIIQEGRQVCINCEKKVSSEKGVIL